MLLPSSGLFKEYVGVLALLPWREQWALAWLTIRPPTTVQVAGCS